MSYKTPREIEALREASQQNIEATRRYIQEQRIKAQEPADYLFCAVNQHAQRVKQAVMLYPEPPEESPMEAATAVPAAKEGFNFLDGVSVGLMAAATIGLIGAVLGVVFVL